MKLKEIHRTSTLAWSPNLSVPLIATGTVAGALDESFSNDSQLEIWEPNFLDKNEYALGGDAGQPAPKASVTTSARCNRLAWGYVDSARPRGVIAAGMENGELGIWDPVKIFAKEDSLVFQNNTHTGPVRGLDFNPLQANLLASGAINGEIYIWDLKDMKKPYTPGTRSAKIDEITAIAWNNHVPHILASSSSTGYTVVWDLRGKREMVALAYSGGSGITGGSIHGNATAMGSRRGMSDISWHPDNATRLVTASEDDTSPIVMSWDLRNARAPEKILTGHEKGVLSLSWCKQDSDLLLSCGKDNRVLCWNPQTAEIIGELPPANNWAFQVEWCPRNPDLFATAFFDGTVGVHSIQSTNEGAAITESALANGADIFDSPNFGQIGQANLSLKQPPKWLRRPASVSCGFGGRLVTVGNLPNAQGRNQSSFVHIRTVTTEKDIIERAKKLQDAVDKQTLNGFAEEKAKHAQGKSDDSESWKALLSLFRTNSREELITLFGLSKEAIASQVEEAIKKVKASASPATETETDEDVQGTPHEPVVSFIEPEKEETPRDGADSPPQSAGPVASEATPSEFSMSATSDGTKAADIESTTTEHSLFADDVGTPQTEAAVDFFSSMGTLRSAVPAHMQVPHTNYAHDSSVAATMGSRSSSIASLKNNTFSIHPKDTSEVDKLLTKALVLGDFESAVSLCLASDRFADAILLAVKGGPELLAKTQKAYFERQTVTLPYLRLFQSIVTDDLEDIVQNADLHDWREIFVILCTFAKAEEFPSLVEQLGQRLEFQGSVVKTATSENAQTEAHKFRKHATLCYLAATKLEKVVNIWIDEMREEEVALKGSSDEVPADASRYTVHAQALQTFIEKVTVFRGATSYVDGDLKQAPTDAEAKTYKLAALYDRYYEYADLLASQGFVSEAVKYLENTPADYRGTPGSDVEFDVARERLISAAGTSATPKVSPVQSLAAASAPAQSTTYAQPGYAQSSYPSYGAPHTHQAPATQPTQPSGYPAYNPPAPANTSTSSNPYSPPSVSSVPPTTGTSPWAPPNPYGGASGPYSRPGIAQTTAPPPPTSRPPPPSAPPKRDAGGWNDAPSIDRRSTPSQAGSSNKPTPIVTPFPNAPVPPAPVTPMSPYLASQQPQAPPPPPRAGTSTPSRMGPPPPRGPASHAPPPPGPLGSFAPPPQAGQFAPASAGRSGPPPQRLGAGGPGPVPPPGRVMSPPQGPPRPMSGAPQFANAAPPPANGPYAPRAQPTPPPHGQPQMTGAPGYGAGPGPAPGPGVPPPPPGPYAPPPGAQRPGPPGRPGMQVPPPGPPPAGGHLARPPPGSGPSGAPLAAPPGPPPKPAPPAPKYPPGDRSHIPDSTRPAYELLNEQLTRMRQMTPPAQKRLVDDTERRLNALFDALNCETLSQPVVDMLMNLIAAMAARNRDAAMNLHVEMLTRGTSTDDIALWMAAIKQLIIRL